MSESDYPERCLETWEEIANFFNVSEQMMKRRRQELFACGVVFYKIQGKPKHRRVCAFPSALIAWISAKARAGENF